MDITIRLNKEQEERFFYCYEKSRSTFTNEQYAKQLFSDALRATYNYHSHKERSNEE